MVDQLAAAAQALATRNRRGARVMVVVRDPNNSRFLVYNLDLTHLFSPRPRRQRRRRRRPQSDGKLHTLANPLTVLTYTEFGIDIEFAASASGHVIAAADSKGRTFIVDPVMRSLSSIPGTRHVKPNFFHVPVGDNAFFLMSTSLISPTPQDQSCELLFSTTRRSSSAASGAQSSSSCCSSWGWCPVPDPPGLHPRGEVTCYFVAGAHVWLSLWSKGTFSFDTVSRRWHTQGTWELPFQNAALFVPDFRGTGRNLLFGFVGAVLQLSVCDMDAMPPAVITTWQETVPSSNHPYAFSQQTVELAYFGDGRFCISLNAAIRTQEEEEYRPPPLRSILSLLAVEITRDLKLIKRQFTRYSLPPCSHTTHLI